MRPAPIILYFNGTFVNRTNGAHVRMSALLRFLLAGPDPVIVYSYADHPDCPWGAAEIARFAHDFPKARLVLDRRPAWLVLATKAKKWLSGAVPGWAPWLLALRLPGATPGYERLCHGFPDARLIVNYANGLVELNGVVPGRAVIETHDLDFLQFSKRFGHALSSRRIAAKFRSEFALLDHAAALISIAPIEAGLFRLCFAEKAVFFIPDYGVSGAPRPVPQARPAEYDLLFVGSENPFNVAGIVGFMAAHRAFLRHHDLVIAGRASLDPEVVAAAAGCARVRLLGFVDDIDALYRRARLVISPVDGTGLKIKVVEALAAGKPVFGSRHTIDGLPPGSGGCVFPIDPAAMTAMLDDPDALARAGLAARAYARNLASTADLAAFEAFLKKWGEVTMVDRSVATVRPWHRHRSRAQKEPSARP